jgi:hypothetical protein
MEMSPAHFLSRAATPSRLAESQISLGSTIVPVSETWYELSVVF